MFLVSVEKHYLNFHHKMEYTRDSTMTSVWNHREILLPIQAEIIALITYAYTCACDITFKYRLRLIPTRGVFFFINQKRFLYCFYQLMLGSLGVTQFTLNYML